MMLLMKMAIMTMVMTTTVSYTWRDLTQEELEGWYTPTDLCMLQSTERNKFPQDVRSGNCSKFSRGSRRVNCGVGMGTIKQCMPPFSVARPSFFKGIVGFTDPTVRQLFKPLSHFIKTNTTLVFLGDSTMRQKLAAMDCQLQREDHRIRHRGNLFGILPCQTDITVFMPDGLGTLDVRGISIGPNSANCLKNGKGKRAVAGGIFENAAEIIRHLNEDLHRNVFVIANLGLWYNDEDSFEDVIPAVLDWLVTVAKSKIVTNMVAWHETMSQHWYNEVDSGYFNKFHADDQEASWVNKSVNIETIDLSTFQVLSQPFHMTYFPVLINTCCFYDVRNILQVPHCCKSFSNTSWMADWRNDIVKKHIALNNRYKHIYYWPFVEATRPLADLHVCHQYSYHDCTHYCFTPLLFQPLWRQIADHAELIQ